MQNYIRRVSFLDSGNFFKIFLLTDSVSITPSRSTNIIWSTQIVTITAYTPMTFMFACGCTSRSFA